MNTRNAAVLAAMIAISSPAAFDAHARPAGATGKALFTSAAEIKWSDVPGIPGVQLAALQGDPSKGPSHFMLKYVGGFAAPLHHHTTDHYGTVVAGTLVLISDGKEARLPAGSYFAFTGKMPHVTKCEAGADCVLSMDARGKWDIVPEAGKATARK